MTRSTLLLASACAAAALAVSAPSARAESRYAARPPVVLSPDLAGPWIMQLRPSYRDVTGPVVYAPPPPPEPAASRYGPAVRQAAIEQGLSRRHDLVPDLARGIHDR